METGGNQMFENIKNIDKTKDSLKVEIYSKHQAVIASKPQSFQNYIKQMDWKKFWLFLDYTAQHTKKNKISILIDVVASVFNYNISILEYFQFRFRFCLSF